MCLILHILLVVFEVRLMKKYDFSLDGIPISVITLSDPMTVRQAVADSLCDGYAVFIYPECDADFGVLCIDKNNIEPREPYLALTALSCFFSAVRHLPQIAFNVLYRGVIHELAVHDGERNFSVNGGKCKILCTKTVKYADGVEVTSYIIGVENTCICTVCNDSDLFCTERLLELARLAGVDRNTPSVAISGGECIRVKSVGAIPYYLALAYADSLLLHTGRRSPLGINTALVNGREHTFLLSSDKLTFYPNIKYLY